MQTEIAVADRGCVTFQMDMPPEASMCWALTQRLSSESSEAIIGPMSSGRPTCPSAVMSATRLLISGLSRTIPPLKSVAIAPGATTLTVILRGPNSLAMYFVSTSIAPFIEP
jgi:hypothetical protein